MCPEAVWASQLKSGLKIEEGILVAGSMSNPPYNQGYAVVEEQEHQLAKYRWSFPNHD